MNKMATAEISPKSAFKMVQSGAKLVDVRTAQEFQARHVEGAINIPLHEVAQGKNIPDANEPIIVCDNNGLRSKDAAEKLGKMGYKRVYDVGNIMDSTYNTKWIVQ